MCKWSGNEAIDDLGMRLYRWSGNEAIDGLEMGQTW